MRRLRSARQNTAKREREREGKLAIVIVIVVCLIYASLLLRALHVLRQHVRTVFPPRLLLFEFAANFCTSANERRSRAKPTRLSNHTSSALPNFASLSLSYASSTRRFAVCVCVCLHIRIDLVRLMFYDTLGEQATQGKGERGWVG